MIAWPPKNRVSINKIYIYVDIERYSYKEILLFKKQSIDVD